MGVSTVEWDQHWKKQNCTTTIGVALVCCVSNHPWLRLRVVWCALHHFLCTSLPSLSLSVGVGGKSCYRTKYRSMPCHATVPHNIKPYLHIPFMEDFKSIGGRRAGINEEKEIEKRTQRRKYRCEEGGRECTRHTTRTNRRRNPSKSFHIDFLAETIFFHWPLNLIPIYYWRWMSSSRRSNRRFFSLQKWQILKIAQE